MINCQPKDGVCQQCGQVVGNVLRRCPGNDTQKRKKPPVLLGDRIEAALTSAGITKDRWISFKALFGLPPTCNCNERKAALNSADEWFRAATEHLGETAKTAIETVWKPIKPKQ